MFVQGANGTIKITVSLPEENLTNVSILDGATVSLLIQKRDYEFERECIIIDAVLGEAMCYLTPEDLKFAGNYEYQVIVKYANNRIVKSYVNSFYVQPSIEMTVEVI